MCVEAMFLTRNSTLFKQLNTALYLQFEGNTNGSAASAKCKLVTVTAKTVTNV